MGGACAGLCGGDEPDPKPEPTNGGGNNNLTVKPNNGGDSKEVEVHKGLVTRKEIRSMSTQETNRFFNAVDKMLENKSGNGTSEFYRIASYHGQPPPIYCEHGRETFPGWHRIYMLEFENALRSADKELGNDGSIFLPYWDWLTNQDDGIPKVVRERFKSWPKGFWPDNVDGFGDTVVRASDSEATANLKSWNVSRDAVDSLRATQHWAHASTRHRGTYPSIEKSHNSIHVIVGGNGGPMGSVAWAAFDIMFWLHHCNVDRIYESYLKLEPDSEQEFENFQDQQRNDMFDRDFEPFRKNDGSKYRPDDTFSPETLGYKYAALLPPPDQQLREPPTFILFSQVKVYEFESKCYQIHAYVIDGDKEDEFKEPQTKDDIDHASDNYAGGAGIFGRGMECQNCMNRPAQDIVIDITETLNKLNIDRYKAKAKIYILETTETSPNLIALSDTPLPEPIITGPLFVNRDNDDMYSQDDKDSNNKHEVEAIQRFLQKFGYYAPESAIDGDYGPITKQAVEDYQTATGDLKVDGVVGPKTREAMITKKRCENIDPFAKNEVKDVQCDGIDYNNKESEVKYYIATQPGYLNKDEVSKAVAAACTQYDEVSSLKFIQVDDEKDCNIKFSWDFFEKENDPMRFDGAGGVLGRAGKGYVEFDRSERWCIGLDNDDEKQLNLDSYNDKKTWLRGNKPTVSLYYTALHELGHALGLEHSINPNDVMSPWYNPKQTKLSENDIQNIQKIIDKDGGDKIIAKKEEKQEKKEEKPIDDKDKDNKDDKDTLTTGFKSFSTAYTFDDDDQIVILKHSKGKTLRIDPKNESALDENGGAGKFARWSVEFDGGGKLQIVKIKSVKSGKYVRIFKDGKEINVAGTGGKFTRFKVHKTKTNNCFKLESCEFAGKYIAVQAKGIAIGTGGKWTKLSFWKEQSGNYKVGFQFKMNDNDLCYSIESMDDDKIQCKQLKSNKKNEFPVLIHLDASQLQFVQEIKDVKKAAKRPLSPTQKKRAMFEQKNKENKKPEKKRISVKPKISKGKLNKFAGLHINPSALKPGGGKAKVYNKDKADGGGVLDEKPKLEQAIFVKGKRKKRKKKKLDLDIYQLDKKEEKKKAPKLYYDEKVADKKYKEMEVAASPKQNNTTKTAKGGGKGKGGKGGKNNDKDAPPQAGGGSCCIVL